MHQIITFTFVKNFLTFPSPVLNLLYPTAAVCILLLPGLYLFLSTELVLVLGTWALVVQAGEHWWYRLVGTHRNVVSRFGKMFNFKFRDVSYGTCHCILLIYIIIKPLSDTHCKLDLKGNIGVNLYFTMAKRGLF